MMHISGAFSNGQTNSAEIRDFCYRSEWSFQNIKHHVKYRAFCLTMQSFGDVFEEKKH